MIQMNNSGLTTIDQFNKLTGHEMLHDLHDPEQKLGSIE